MRPTAAALALGLLAAACSPKTGEGSARGERASAPGASLEDATPAPAPLPADFVGDIDARGTEPFWALEIRAGGLKLQRPDHADVTAPNAGPRMAGEAGTFGEAGGPLYATLRIQSCSDGMSDKQYPMAAEVRVDGETLRGCAAPAGG